MKFFSNKKYFVIALLLAGLAVFTYKDYSRQAAPLSLATALIVPDDVPLEGHFVQMWQAAAQEDGVMLKTVRSSQWIDSVARFNHTWESAILPDTFYRKASPSLLIALEKFVQEGGKLMVVYDGASLNEKGAYSTITFHWNDANKVLTILDQIGSFPGMLLERKFNIVRVTKNTDDLVEQQVKTKKTIVYRGNKIVVKL